MTLEYPSAFIVLVNLCSTINFIYGTNLQFLYQIENQIWVLSKNIVNGKIIIEIDTNIVLITYFSEKSLK